jgi:type II secretory pathway pseudopilin PulG
MTALRREDGFSLPELLVGMLLMIIVMSASLLVLDQFTALSKRTDRAVEVQDAARSTSRQLSRTLRNLASSPDLPGVVERARPYDLVFRTVDRPRAGTGSNTRNLHRVRYCLRVTGADADTDAGRLVEQTQRWTSSMAPSIPNASACPGPGWDGTRYVAERLTHRSGPVDRPLWTYGRAASGEIASVKLNLFMNAVPETPAREVALQTGVFLRNENRAPTAMFTATVVGIRHVLLNGSPSTDPEGQPLDFHWYADGREVGRGLVFDYYAETGGRHEIGLEVFDPSGLSHRSPGQSVVVE